MDFIMEVESLEECRNTCLSRTNCNYYSYQGRRGGMTAHLSHCYLYSSCSSLRTHSPVTWVTGRKDYPADCFKPSVHVPVHNFLRQN